MSVSQMEHTIIRYTVIVYFWLCCNMITNSMQSIFGNHGLCCKSPEQCSITDCGINNMECCRMNDDYTCNDISNNIYEGSFRIPMNNNINKNDNNNDNVYFRLYSDHIYFEYKYTNNNAIGISWTDYNHPYPDYHFTIFASDINNNNKWQMFDMLVDENKYTLEGSTQEYNCPSVTGYCLSNRQLNINYQPYYNLFDFIQPLDNNESIFVWERKYTTTNGLYEFDKLYESINNDQSDHEICFNYAIFENESIGNGGEKVNKMDTICSKVNNICDNNQKINYKMCATNKIDLVIILDVTL
eukprot:169944_1